MLSQPRTVSSTIWTPGEKQPDTLTHNGGLDISHHSLRIRELQLRPQLYSFTYKYQTAQNIYPPCWKMSGCIENCYFCPAQTNVRKSSWTWLSLYLPGGVVWPTEAWCQPLGLRTAESPGPCSEHPPHSPKIRKKIITEDKIRLVSVYTCKLSCCRLLPYLLSCQNN